MPLMLRLVMISSYLKTIAGKQKPNGFFLSFFNTPYSESYEVSSEAESDIDSEELNVIF